MDDLISRQDAIKAVTYGALSSATLFGRSDAGMTALRETVRAIEQLPSAQPQRILARWETIKNADGASIDFRCSACHRFRFHNGELRKYKFCPNCGAKIEQSTGNG